MSHIRNESPLHCVQMVLFVPVDENDRGARQNQRKQDSPLHQRKPAWTLHFHLGSKLRGHFAELCMLFQVPTDPHDHQENP